MSKKNGVAPVLPQILKHTQCPLPQDEDALKHHPCLCEILHPLYRDGKLVREGAMLTVRCCGSDYMVSINCPTENVTITLIVHSIIDLLVHVESSLSAGNYTYDKSYRAKKRARQKLEKELP